MKTEKRIHCGYTEWIKSNKSFTKIFGKWQYLFSEGKNVISCVRFVKYLGDKSFWEIYCLKGKLFDDVERFDTFEEAKKKCEKLLSQLKGGRRK